VTSQAMVYSLPLYEYT